MIVGVAADSGCGKLGNPAARGGQKPMVFLRLFFEFCVFSKVF